MCLCRNFVTSKNNDSIIQMDNTTRLGLPGKVVITSSTVHHGNSSVGAVTKSNSQQAQEVMATIEPDQLNFDSNIRSLELCRIALLIANDDDVRKLNQLSTICGGPI